MKHYKSVTFALLLQIGAITILLITADTFGHGEEMITFIKYLYAGLGLGLVTTILIIEVFGAATLEKKHEKPQRKGGPDGNSNVKVIDLDIDKILASRGMKVVPMDNREMATKFTGGLTKEPSACTCPTCTEARTRMNEPRPDNKDIGV